MEVGGTWTGYYLDLSNDSGEFPLRAEISVDQGRLTGTMIDERVETRYTLKEILRAVPPNSPHARSWAHFAAEYPEAVMTSTLPRNSTIAGSIQGIEVEFTKRYEGEGTTTWSAPNLTPRVETDPMDPIEYRGIVNDDGTEIWGSWRILAQVKGGIESVAAEGTFRLKKVP